MIFKTSLNFLFIFFICAILISVRAADDDGEDQESSALKIPDQTIINSFLDVITPEPGLIFAIKCSNRTVWSGKRLRSMKGWVTEAEKIAGTDIPDWSDSIYTDVLVTGDRPKGEAMMDNRSNRLFYLAMAECYYDSGNFTAQFNRELESVASQKSWAWPAHGI